MSHVYREEFLILHISIKFKCLYYFGKQRKKLTRKRKKGNLESKHETSCQKSRISVTTQRYEISFIIPNIKM